MRVSSGHATPLAQPPDDGPKPYPAAAVATDLLAFVQLVRPFNSDDNPDDINDADKLQARQTVLTVAISD